MTSIHSITKASSRLVSLDVFRGLTVMFMILVNNPGDWGHIYKPLEHAEWNGCTLADLVFPFFLFIVGISTVYSLETKSKYRPIMET
jgi:predicted acyltransferase